MLADKTYLYRSKICLVIMLNFVDKGVGKRAGNITNDENTTKAISILESILAKVDRRVRPNVYSKPLQVDCDFYVQSFSSINEADMDFQMDVYFRQRWWHPQLAFVNQSLPVIIPTPFVDRFWHPDLYFPNEKSGRLHNIVGPNEVIKVFKGGLVRHSTRLNLVLSCPMYLIHYPLDYQDCHVKISSYTYSKADVILQWHGRNPIEMNTKMLSLPQFHYLGHSLGHCAQHYSTGDFSCLLATFHFKRLVGYYVLQNFIPSILIVVLSWLSFWIDKNAAPARITLGVTTVLTMTTQLSSARNAYMMMSYPTAIDVWYTFCMILVFAALCEYALVNVLSRWQRAEQKKQAEEGAIRSKNDSVALSETIVEMDAPTGSINSMQFSRQQSVRTRLEGGANGPKSTIKRNVVEPISAHINLRMITAEALDKTSRVIFPSAFVLFNISYWIVYSQPRVFFSPLFESST